MISTLSAALNIADYYSSEQNGPLSQQFLTKTAVSEVPNRAQSPIGAQGQEPTSIERRISEACQNTAQPHYLVRRLFRPI